MSILGKIQSAARVAGFIARRPGRALRLMRSMPEMSRGVDAAFGWPTPPPESALDTPVHNPFRAYARTREDTRGLWKLDHYFDIYQTHFARFIGQPVTIMEIGIYSGGSLGMWRHVLGDQCRIIGVDIDPDCRAYANDHTQILIGDQADRAFWARARAEIGQVDIVVDDGGHLTEQQIVTFEEMMPRIRPGGVFLCEDVHKPYNPFSGYAWGLMQGLSAVGKVEGTRAEAEPFQSEIASIHTYPYAIVVEKRPEPIDALVSERFGTEWRPWPEGIPGGKVGV